MTYKIKIFDHLYSLLAEINEYDNFNFQSKLNASSTFQFEISLKNPFAQRAYVEYYNRVQLIEVDDFGAEYVLFDGFINRITVSLSNVVVQCLSMLEWLKLRFLTANVGSSTVTKSIATIFLEAFNNIEADYPTGFTIAVNDITATTRMLIPKNQSLYYVIQRLIPASKGEFMLKDGKIYFSTFVGTTVPKRIVYDVDNPNEINIGQVTIDKDGGEYANDIVLQCSRVNPYRFTISNATGIAQYGKVTKYIRNDDLYNLTAINDYLANAVSENSTEKKFSNIKIEGFLPSEISVADRVSVYINTGNDILDINVPDMIVTAVTFTFNNQNTELNVSVANTKDPLKDFVQRISTLGDRISYLEVNV